MEIAFSERTKNSIPSLIREVGIRGAKIPGFISFALGNPCSEAIPAEAIRHMADKVLSENPMKVLQYGAAKGNPEFSAQIVEKLTTEMEFPEEDNDILIVSGSQQGLDMMPRILCNDGDGVYVDEFVFTGALNAMKNMGAVPIGIPMDQDGMIPEELEKAAQTGNGKYIYLIPNFHNPTGITMPTERRKKIYEIAKRYNLIIYEDNPYGRLRYRGEEQECFKHMDTENIVLYAGSFSKTLSAGLRVGFLYGPKALIQKLTAVKGSMDAQSPMLNQLIVSDFLKEYDYKEHIAAITRLYQKKYDTMIHGLQKYCADKCEITIPDGGMFVWITLPENVDCDAVYEEAMKRGLGIVRSLAFAANPGKPGKSFRLNFSYPSVEEIQKGTKIFGEVLEEFVS